jgi:hypothetical protein
MQEFSRALRSPAPVVINPPWSVNARELNGRRWSHLLFVVLLGIPLAVHAGEPKTYQGAASQAFSQFFAANRNDDCTAHSWPYDRDLFVYAEMPHCSWLTKVTASGFCDDAVRISGISNYIDVGFGDCVANNFSVDATHCVDQAARDLRFAAFDKTNIGDNNNMGVSGDVAYEFTVTTFTLYDSYVGLEVDGVVTWYGLSGTGLGKVPSVVTGNAVRIVGCDVKTSPGGGGYCGCDQVKLTVSQSGGSSIQQDMIWDSNVNGNDKWRIASAISRTFKPGDVVTLRFDGKMDGFPAGWARELKYANNGEGASFSIVENRIDLKGRVLDHKTRAPLPGATVKLVRDGSVAGTTTTGSDGRYSFGGLVAGGTVDLIFTNFSYLTQQCSVTLPTNGKEVTAPDIYLARLTSKPVVERIEEDVSGIWLPGFNQTLETKVYVNWNGNRPGTTYVYANGRQGFDTLIGTIVNDRAVYRVSFPVDSYFLPSIAPGANMITAQAASRDGSSEVVSLEVNVLPVPVSLEAFRNYWNITEQGPGTSVGMDFKFPNPPMAGMRNVPLIGPVGCTLAAKMGFSYDVVGAAWSIYAGFEGAGTNAIRFGDTSIGLAGDITGKGSWPKHAVPKTEVSGKITASISPAEITLFRISPLGLLGSAFRSYINKVPYLRSILRAVTVSVIAKPEGVGEFAFSLHPQCQVESGTFSGKIAVFGKYEPKFGKKFKLSIVVGGEPRFVFQVSWDPFKEAAFKVYASAETEIFSLQQKFEHVVIDWAYTNSLLRSQTVLDVASPEGKEGWQFVERTWRRRPTAVSLLDSIHGSLDPVDSSALDRFSALGKTWPPGCAVSRKPARSAAPRVVSSIPSLAELPLLGNVYPDSSPALATRADTILLVYVRDNGAVNPAQFTEIAWTYYDGTNWTAPGAIAPVPNGQFSPRVAFDGAGRALAVWEQVKDPDFATNDLDLMAAEIEVMAAVWNPVTRAWDAPTAITDNGHLDHTPQLGGPLASGDLLLAWVANEGNQFGGSGDAGSISNSTYWTRTWSSASASWSPSMALATGLVFELGASLAAGGSRGVLAWTRDLDGETEELEEADIFSCMYDDASHSWSEALNRTADAVSDSEVQVVVGSTGQVCMVWRRGDDLVMDSEEGGTPALVRSNVTSMGFGDFALSFSPDGYLAAIWQDENRMGSDAHCRIWDPASSSWSQDMLLSEDEDLERSFALGWDAMGNLLMAYNNVALVWTSKVVELEGGGSVTISNIPDSGQVDLLIARRALVRDLAIATNGLAVTGTNFQPGATVAITARVANVGCVAIENPVVAFYDGDPASGGVRIGHVTNAGWLRAAADVACGLTWELPSTAVLHRVYAVVDPDGAVTEYSETNNSSSLAIGGIDVDISYVRGSVMTDGSVRVVGASRTSGVRDHRAQRSPCG